VELSRKIIALLIAMGSYAAFAPTDIIAEFYGETNVPARNRFALEVAKAGLDAVGFVETAAEREFYAALLAKLQAQPANEIPARETFFLATRVIHAINNHETHPESMGRGYSKTREKVDQAEIDRLAKSAEKLALKAHAQLATSEQVFSLLAVQNKTGNSADVPALFQQMSEGMTLPQFLLLAASYHRVERDAQAELASKAYKRERTPGDTDAAVHSDVERTVQKNAELLIRMRPGDKDAYSPEVKKIIEGVFRGVKFQTAPQGQYLTEKQAKENRLAHVKAYIDAILADRSYVPPQSVEFAPRIRDRCAAQAMDILRALGLLRK
jgi:hypothetical protein